MGAKRQPQARMREASGGFLGRLVSCLSPREMPPAVSQGRSGSRRPGCGKRLEVFWGRLVSCLSRREMPPAVSQGRRSSRRPGCGKRRGRFACKPAWLPDAARGPQAAARVTGWNGCLLLFDGKKQEKTDEIAAAPGKRKRSPKEGAAAAGLSRMRCEWTSPYGRSATSSRHSG